MPVILQSGFPFSRFVTWDDSEIESNAATKDVARGDRQGAYIVASRTHPEYYITGHAEYSGRNMGRRGRANHLKLD